MITMRQLKTVSKYLMAVFWVYVGFIHFIWTDFYIGVVPAFLPWPQLLVYVSGIIEIVLGLLLLLRRYARQSAWGIIVLLLILFPANIYLFLNPHLPPKSPLIYLHSLPLQVVLGLWAFWHTKE